MNRNNILALTDADVNGIDDSNLYESRLKLKPQLTRPAATRVVITHLFAQVYPEYLPSPLIELLLRQVSSVHTPHQTLLVRHFRCPRPSPAPFGAHALV